MRKFPALIVALGLIASLSACASETSVAGCSGAIASGDASSIVTATGKPGSAPKIDFPTPLVARTTQRSVVIEGKGDALQLGQPVILDYTILNGTTQKVLQKSTYSPAKGTQLTVDDSVVGRGLRCAQVGSRVVVVASAKDSHGGQEDPSSGLGKNDSIVYVLDVKRAFPARADGAPQVPQNGLPAVVLAPNGAPGLTIPATTPPKSLQVDVLKAGSGKKLGDGDFAVLKYTGVFWADSKVFDSTWVGDKKGQSAVLEIADGKVISGFVKGLVGQRVGSQVLLVVPPSEGYGPNGSQDQTVPPNSTLVYVVDILGIV